jgi:hypothetical protein
MQTSLEQLAGQMPTFQKHRAWFVCGGGFSFLWFCIDICLHFYTEDENWEKHPMFGAITKVMDFPLCYIAHMEGSAVIFILNCMLWGFFLAWLLRVASRRILRLEAKNDASRTRRRR